MNVALLTYEMKRAGVTITEMCEKLEMSRSAFFRKCNGTSEFKQSEIQKIIKILNLKSPVDIFLQIKCLLGHFNNS